MSTSTGKTVTILGLALAVLLPITQQLSAQGPPQGAGVGPRGPRAGDARPGDGRALEHVRQFVEQLKEEQPDEYKRLMELREDDPEKFRQEMRTLMREKFQDRRGMRGRSAEDQQAFELAQQYQQAETDAEKEVILAKLEETVAKAYEARLEQQQQMLERMKERMKDLEERLEKRQENRDEIIETRVEQLTKDPSLRW